MAATLAPSPLGSSLSSPLLENFRDASSFAGSSPTSPSSPSPLKVADMVTVREVSTDRSDWTAACSVGDTFAGLDRRARYMRMAQRWAEPETQTQQERKRFLGRTSSRWLRERNTAAFLSYFVVHNASLACIAWLATSCCRFVALAVFLPPYVLVAAMTVWTAYVDREVTAVRLHLRRKAALCRLLCFDVLVIVFLGAFFGLLFLKARKLMEAETSFVTELEKLDASRREIAIKPRFETHMMCVWGAPIILGCSYTLGTMPLATCDAIAVAVLLGNGICTVALGFVNFDFSTSRFIRERYGTKWDGQTWVQQDRRLFFAFRKTHQAFRLAGVAVRFLVFTAGSVASLHFPLAVLALGASDFLLVLALLGSKSRRSLGLVVLGIGAFITDPCRFVDEPGFALPAQQTSTAMVYVHAAEVGLAAAAFACSSFPRRTGAEGPLSGQPSQVLLILLILLSLIHFCLGNLSALGRQEGDLFSAVARGDVDAIEDALVVLGSGPECSANLRLNDRTHRVPLHFAVQLSQVECIRCLLRNGADATLQDMHGDTPVHLAAKAGDQRLVEVLLECDGGEECAESSLRSLLQTNKAGQSPLDALPKGAPEELRRLVEERTKTARRELRVRFSVRDCSSASGVDYELSNSVFGKVVGGEGFHIAPGPLRSPACADLAALLLRRGIGHTISTLYEDVLEWRSGALIRLSSLRMARTLGEGNFGRVLEVQDMRSGQFYAMKLQRKTLAAKCAMREAVALHATRHPFIVRVVHIFHTTALFGILMEFCEMDLNKRICEHVDDSGRIRGLPSAKCARYTACMTLALEHLHSRSIVFCDLKPENVLTTFEEEGDLAKLADFGLARNVASLDAESIVTQQKSGYRAGTPAFLPCEVWQGSPKIQTEDDFMDCFASRDWYALGCCLLLMLLGEHGGRKAFAGGRHVLLPLAQDEVPAVLARAGEMHLADEADALRLVADLMAPEPSERAGLAELRVSRLLRDAIANLEAAFPCG